MKVSVCLITYKHEKYIAKAIEGIVMQKTSFPFRLVIGEDAGDDGTRKICEQYAARYPGIIHLLPSDKRYGMIENLHRTLNEATGDYIAFCEGDDYWCDPKKLQKQVDFLDSNPAFSLCCHDVFFQVGKKKQRSHHWDVPQDTDIHYLLRHANYIATLSIVFRNDKRVFDFIRRFEAPPLGDYLIYVAAARIGRIRFFNERMGVYRVHAGGSWSQFNIGQAMDRFLKVIYMLADELEEEYLDDLRIQLISRLELMVRVEGAKAMDARPELDKLFAKLQIPGFIREYVIDSVNERKKKSYYSRNVPVSLLVKGLLEKVNNNLPRL